MSVMTLLIAGNAFCNVGRRGDVQVMNGSALVGVDWGTSSLRLWRFSSDGAVVDVRRSERGILSVPAGSFRDLFEQAAGDWLTGDVPVLMCGMIGSRQGWVEAPYVNCPAAVSNLADHLQPVPGYRKASIVPGVALCNSEGRRDVMRGEETQILGARLGAGRHLLVLPGTHSKWVFVEDGCIRDFCTFMTGEIYNLLRHQSILSRLMPDHDADIGQSAFEGAVRAAIRAEGRVMQGLFGIRARGLFEDLPPATAPATLSGLLIGAEICEGLSFARAHGVQTPTPLIIGSSCLTQRYADAFQIANLTVHTEDEGAGARGLWAIARQKGLV